MSIPDSILAEDLQKHWNISPGSVELIRDLSNKVYLGKNEAGQELVIRLTPNKRRSSEQIHAELEWLLFLNSKRLPVTHPLISNQKKYFHSIMLADQLMHIVVFEKFNGDIISHQNRNLWQPSLFKKFGLLMGQLHSEAKRYIPKETPRPQWFEDPIFQDFSKYKGIIDDPIIFIAQEHLEKVAKFSKDTETYGLIHDDFKLDNFLYKNDKLFLFDFDQSRYHWYINDFSNFIFYLFAHPMIRIPQAKKEDIEAFIGNFYNGYQQFKIFNLEEIKMIPDLMKLREILIYLLVKPISKKIQWPKDQYFNCTVEESLNEIKQRILNKSPSLDLDFTRVLSHE